MVKKPIQKHSNDELSNFPLKGIVDGWSFRVDEISQGYYRIEGMDRFGRIISRDGINPEDLIKECKEDIKRLFPGNPEK